MNDLSKSTVLVVDDERFVLRTTARILQNMGFGSVLMAATAPEALEIIATSIQSIDVVLTDLNMPGMDGVDLLRLFSERGFRGNIILFSGEDEQTLQMAEALAKARNLSVLGSIAKPVDQAALMALLAQSQEPEIVRKRSKSALTAPMLEQAIANGELEPWFQPKIDIASKAPIGVEALARWPKSEIGPVFPDTFIPIAEANNLIDPLTYLIAAKSAQYAHQWRQQGIQLIIALNVSMDSLYDLEFPRKLVSRIEATQGRTADFQLEITESRLMQNIVAPLDVLLRMRLKKIKLSIDDFGTGHSNLSQLRDLPFDELKLDRSYVRGALANKRTHSILESCVTMAKKLGMSVVAEGVETREDWLRVSELGCDQVQGWFTAKPMPGDEIIPWMKSWPSVYERLEI